MQESKVEDVYLTNDKKNRTVYRKLEWSQQNSSYEKYHVQFSKEFAGDQCNHADKNTDKEAEKKKKEVEIKRSKPAPGIIQKLLEAAFLN